MPERMGALLALVGLVMLGANSAVHRPYTQISPGQFAAVHQTHVCTTGVVALKHQEADGDLHLRIEADGAFIVAEEIPALPVSVVRLVKVGQRVRVCGIRRYDDAPGHKWYEIHPIERLEILDGKQR